MLLLSGSRAQLDKHQQNYRRSYRPCYRRYGLVIRPTDIATALELVRSDLRSSYVHRDVESRIRSRCRRSMRHRNSSDESTTNLGPKV